MRTARNGARQCIGLIEKRGNLGERCRIRCMRLAPRKANLCQKQAHIRQLMTQRVTLLDQRQALQRRPPRLGDPKRSRPACSPRVGSKYGARSSG